MYNMQITLYIKKKEDNEEIERLAKEAGMSKSQFMVKSSLGTLKKKPPKGIRELFQRR